MHNDVSGAHEHSTLLCLDQVVLSHGHSVLPAIAACLREEYEKNIKSEKPLIANTVINIFQFSS